MLLALDTATRSMSIALHNGETLLAEQTWITANNRHTEALAPAIHTLLDLCELSIDQVSALAVATGPGSYTGLRIGVSFAKGLASAKLLPLVGMTTLDILAKGQPNPSSIPALIATVQAGRGRIIVQAYRWNNLSWLSRSEPRLIDWNGLAEMIDGPVLVTGEIDDDGRTALAKLEQVRIAPAVTRIRRAGVLAEAAWEQLRTTQTPASTFNAAKVLPVYIQTDKA